MFLRFKRRFVVVLLIVFLWLSLLLSHFIVDESPQDMKKRVLSLSWDYIRALREKQFDIVDSPYVKESNYDMKKTLAVLLDDLNSRLTRLEGRVNVSDLKIASVASRHIVQYSSIIAGIQEKCDLPKNDLIQYPECETRIEWLQTNWKTDSCYSAYGVDGSLCSIVLYLSEVEDVCPLLPIRQLNVVGERANTNLNLTELLSLLNKPSTGRDVFGFISNRMSVIWQRLTEVMKNNQTTNSLIGQRRKLTILFYIGSLSQISKFLIIENIKAGGPLGELVQWSDIISAHFILGHNIQVIAEYQDLQAYFKGLNDRKNACQGRRSLNLDLIITDLIGVRHINGATQNRCILRVIDTFGTEPKYNKAAFITSKVLRSPWGGKELHPKQMFTMFPHTPDNSFMGFVILPYEQTAASPKCKACRGKSGKPIAIVYGKVASFWQNHLPFIDVLEETFEVHATVPFNDEHIAILPHYVINHGLLSYPSFSQLLWSAKIYVGLGFPIEGPAPLEALAHGAVFINPIFSPSLGKDNYKFLKEKPTDRRFSSQHSYLEKFVPKPMVYNVDTKSESMFRTVMHEISSMEAIEPFVPVDFRAANFLERVSVFLARLDFCRSRPPGSRIYGTASNGEPWPPISSLRFILGQPGVSCTDSCNRSNFTCDSSHIQMLNTAKDLQRIGFLCHSIVYEDDLCNPSMKAVGVNDACHLLSDTSLFSCSTAPSQPHQKRLCPCQTRHPRQLTICAECL